MAAASLLLLAARLGSGLRRFGSDLQYGVSSAVLVVQALLAIVAAAGVEFIVLISLLWRRRQGPLWLRLAGSFYPVVLAAVLG